MFLCSTACKFVPRIHLREMRSKHFFSSGLVFTWQVSRLSFAGGRLACVKTKPNRDGGKDGSHSPGLPTERQDDRRP